MKIEQQVVSLELAQKLKELGVKQDSIWYWMKMKRPDNWQLACESIISFTFENGASVAKHRKDEFEIFSAFTVAELGEMLPEYYETHKTETLKKEDDFWWNGFIEDGKIELQLGSETFDTEANARAKMVIYLKENKLI